MAGECFAVRIPEFRLQESVWFRRVVVLAASAALLLIWSAGFAQVQNTLREGEENIGWCHNPGGGRVGMLLPSGGLLTHVDCDRNDERETYIEYPLIASTGRFLVQRAEWVYVSWEETSDGERFFALVVETREELDVFLATVPD